MIFTVKNMCLKNHKNLDPDHWISYHTPPGSKPPNIKVKLRVLCFTRRGTKRFQPGSTGSGGWRHQAGNQGSTDALTCDDRTNKKMRIKDFIYGTLPKKNKKKKKYNDHVTVSKKRSRSRDLNKNCGFFPIQHNQCLVSEDFQYKDSDFATSNSSYQLQTIHGNNVGLSQDAGTIFEQIRKESTNSSCDSNSDGNFNTLPKIRSRIKTNPWLPSPKTSPGPSGSTSPMTSSTVSNGVQDFFQVDFLRNRSTSSAADSWHENSESGFYSANCTAGNDSFMSHSANLQNNNNRGEDCIFYPRPDSIDSTDHDSIMHHSFLSEESNEMRSLSPAPIFSNSHRKESGHPRQFDYESEFEEQVERQFTDNIGSTDDVFSVFNSQECLDMDTEAVNSLNRIKKYRESSGSTTIHEENCVGVYENEQYNSCDSSLHEEYTSSPEIIQCSEKNYTDEYFTDKAIYSQEPEGIYPTQPHAEWFDPAKKNPELHGFGGEVQSSTKESDVGDNIEDIDNLTPVVSPIGSLSFDLDDIEFIDAEPHDEEHITPKMPRQGSVEVISSFSPPVQSMPVSHDASSSVVASVQSNLRDKVRKLKQDKEVVDGIVRKAREEQRLRKQELLRIQKQAALARKEILLRTLMELREKLDQQTDRLQSAYENIITFRYNDALQRRYSDVY